jgi:TPR repeat protein
MARIEELILQRQAIEAEIDAEYKKEGVAAARGDAEAQFNLGVIYYTEQGVPKDSHKALSYDNKAARKGDANSSS